MLRMYREFARQLVCTLTYLKYGLNGGEVEGKVIREWITGFYRNIRGNGRDDQEDGLYTILNETLVSETNETFDFNTKKLIEYLTKIMMDFTQNERYRDLVDEIAAILKKPRVGNTLSGKTIENLRKAILTSDEMQGLKERLKKAEMSCALCGISFVNGEMLTMTRDPSNGLNVVCCIGCTIPYYVPCDLDENGKIDCDRKVDLPARTRTALKKLMASGCSKCKEKLATGTQDGVDAGEIAATVGVGVGAIPEDPEDEDRIVDEDGEDDDQDWDVDDNGDILGLEVDQEADVDDGPTFRRFVEAEAVAEPQRLTPPDFGNWRNIPTAPPAIAPARVRWPDIIVQNPIDAATTRLPNGATIAWGAVDEPVLTPRPGNDAINGAQWIIPDPQIDWNEVRRQEINAEVHRVMDQAAGQLYAEGTAPNQGER